MRHIPAEHAERKSSKKTQFLVNICCMYPRSILSSSYEKLTLHANIGGRNICDGPGLNNPSSSDPNPGEDRIVVADLAASCVPVTLDVPGLDVCDRK